MRSLKVNAISADRIMQTGQDHFWARKGWTDGEDNVTLGIMSLDTNIRALVREIQKSNYRKGRCKHKFTYTSVSKTFSKVTLEARWGDSTHTAGGSGQMSLGGLFSCGERHAIESTIPATFRRVIPAHGSHAHWRAGTAALSPAPPSPQWMPPRPGGRAARARPSPGDCSPV